MFDGSWKIPPVIADGEIVIPALSKLRINHPRFRPGATGAVISRHGPARISYDDNQVTVSTWKLYRVVSRPRRRRRLRLVTTFRHRDRMGRNAFRLSGRVRGKPLRSGHYVLRAIATGTDDVSASRQVSVSFRVL